MSEALENGKVGNGARLDRVRHRMRNAEKEASRPLPNTLTPHQAAILNEAANNLIDAIQTGEEILKDQPEIRQRNRLEPAS